MKKLNNFFNVVLCVLFSLIALDSCDSDPVVNAQIQDIGQPVCISQNPVTDGDEVYLSINPLFFDEKGDIIKGESVSDHGIGIPMVRYYIDDKPVGHSNKKSEQFAVKYLVSGLSAGSHTLRAIAEPQEKGVDMHISYTPTQFTVLEKK